MIRCYSSGRQSILNVLFSRIITFLSFNFIDSLGGLLSRQILQINQKSEKRILLVSQSFYWHALIWGKNLLELDITSTMTTMMSNWKRSHLKRFWSIGCKEIFWQTSQEWPSFLSISIPTTMKMKNSLLLSHPIVLLKSFCLKKNNFACLIKNLICSNLN